MIPVIIRKNRKVKQVTSMVIDKRCRRVERKKILK